MRRDVYVSQDVKLGKNVKLSKFINLYGCEVGEKTRIGAFVEIQKNAKVGKNCKISSHTFICEGVTIGKNSFIGHGVVFINDNYPRAVNKDGGPESEDDWAGRLVKINIGNNVSIGSNATILGGIKIGDNSVVGAGSVVTKDIPKNQTWAGNPARCLRKNGVREYELSKR
ncbi:MAG: N-acetyltransferase [Candidatus Omnitrophica bacterium]|nr:N-acetyltransferase [Candidatus Omnitrophota bacterium]